jgi:1-acyl-sn-glycerol-3-phosphate acyltransferase
MTWLGKAELFRGPMGPIMRAMGGIPVNREAASAMVPAMVAEFAKRESLVLTVPVEGTRSKGRYWKSGFYRIAMAADVPVVCGFVDGPRRTGGFGPVMHLTGNVREDMDRIRAFYAGKQGLRPAHTTEPRLRDEDSPIEFDGVS